MRKSQIRYYKTVSDDFFQVGKTYRLPKDYRWIRKDMGTRILSHVLYALALLFSSVYCRLFLHVTFKGAKQLRRHKGGCFLYGNHTQPIGDVFHPALACFPKRIYTVVSVANLHLPVIGRLLPYLGALPIPDTLHGMRDFRAAVEQRVRTGHPVVIYPEAHLWEYYTGIRPFGATSFQYPADLGIDVFCMTTTYQKRKHSRKPKITVYLDGPFPADGDTAKQRVIELRDAVYETMKMRAKNSNCEYIRYQQADAAGDTH